MIKKGQIKQINGLYGFVDIANEEEAKRLTDTEIGDSTGLIIYIPFKSVVQNDIDDSVVFNTEKGRRQKNRM